MIRMSYDPFRTAAEPAAAAALEQYDMYSWQGLYGTFTAAELPGVVDATPNQVRSQVKVRGFACTYCDVEPVALVRHGATLPRSAREWIASEIVDGA